VTGGNISVAQAYASDVSTPEGVTTLFRVKPTLSDELASEDDPFPSYRSREQDKNEGLLPFLHHLL
jgi:hypothetical protein